MEKKIRDFIRNKKAIRFSSVMILFGLAVHFLFIGLLEINILEQVFSLGSPQLNRFISLALSAGIGIVAYGAYIQDEEIVNKRLRELKEKISEEAREIRESTVVKDEKAADEPIVEEQTTVSIKTKKK